jgi:NitT/TauT family transport system substrate-binding protein
MLPSRRPPSTLEQASQPIDRMHIRVTRHSAFYSPLIMTLAGGYLRAEGLDASYDIATPERTVAGGISDGSVQVGQSAVATSFAPLDRGEIPPVMHFAQINERDGFFLVGRHPEPDFTWGRLVGETALIDHFFQPLAMFRYALHRVGIDASRVDMVDAGDVEAMDHAFRTGQGDYVHLQGPGAQQLEKDGIGFVVAAVGEAVGPVAFSSLCASRSWLATDEARAFVRAYRHARSQVIAAPADEIAAAEAGFFPRADRDVLTRTIAAYQQLGCWAPAVEISRGAYEAALDVFEFSGLIRRRHPYHDVVAPPPA